MCQSTGPKHLHYDVDVDSTAVSFLSPKDEIEMQMKQWRKWKREKPEEDQESRRTRQKMCTFKKRCKREFTFDVDVHNRIISDYALRVVRGVDDSACSVYPLRLQKMIAILVEWIRYIQLKAWHCGALAACLSSMFVTQRCSFIHIICQETIRINGIFRNVKEVIGNIHVSLDYLRFHCQISLFACSNSARTCRGFREDLGGVMTPIWWEIGHKWLDMEVNFADFSFCDLDGSFGCASSQRL